MLLQLLFATAYVALACQYMNAAAEDPGHLLLIITVNTSEVIIYVDHPFLLKVGILLLPLHTLLVQINKC